MWLETPLGFLLVGFAPSCFHPQGHAGREETLIGNVVRLPTLSSVPAVVANGAISSLLLLGCHTSAPTQVSWKLSETFPAPFHAMGVAFQLKPHTTEYCGFDENAVCSFFPGAHGESTSRSCYCLGWVRQMISSCYPIIVTRENLLTCIPPISIFLYQKLLPRPEIFSELPLACSLVGAHIDYLIQDNSVMNTWRRLSFSLFISQWFTSVACCIFQWAHAKPQLCQPAVRGVTNITNPLVSRWHI